MAARQVYFAAASGNKPEGPYEEKIDVSFMQDGDICIVFTHSIAFGGGEFFFSENAAGTRATHASCPIGNGFLTAFTGGIAAEGLCYIDYKVIDYSADMTPADIGDLKYIGFQHNSVGAIGGSMAALVIRGASVDTASEEMAFTQADLTSSPKTYSFSGGATLTDKQIRVMMFGGYTGWTGGDGAVGLSWSDPGFTQIDTTASPYASFNGGYGADLTHQAAAFGVGYQSSDSDSEAWDAVITEAGGASSTGYTSGCVGLMTLDTAFGSAGHDSWGD